MSRAGAVVAFLASTSLALPAPAATYCVARTGSDDSRGGCDAPWATLQHAANAVRAGDTVLVRPDTYRGFHLETSGEPDRPITFKADSGVVIAWDNAVTPDGIDLEGVSHVVLEGFTVRGVTRAGIRAVECRQVTIRKNRASQNGRWGIFTGFCDDLLIEDNECSESQAEHGIYVSNSGDCPVIRNNIVWGNNACGIHLNGDVTAGGDGVISGALVESNVVHGNGAGGGSGINCDGVQDSIIQNNLLYDNHASGISLYRIDGGGAAMRNVVVNNTVVMASDGRAALNVQDAGVGTVAYNNILLNANTGRGSIEVSTDSLPLTSDHNVVEDRFGVGHTAHTLAEWRSATGQDAHSLLSTIDELFVQATGRNYHLRAGSAAIDHGTTAEAPPNDLEGNTRPHGDRVDIGAYEYGDQAANGTPRRQSGAGVTPPGGPPAATGRPRAGLGPHRGCGCQLTGRGGQRGWAAAFSIAWLGVRRRRPSPPPS